MGLATRVCWAATDTSKSGIAKLRPYKKSWLFYEDGRTFSTIYQVRFDFGYGYNSMSSTWNVLMASMEYTHEITTPK